MKILSWRDAPQRLRVIKEANRGSNAVLKFLKSTETYKAFFKFLAYKMVLEKLQVRTLPHRKELLYN